MSSSANNPFVSMTQPPATQFITHDVPAPTGLYVGDNDFIRIVCQTTHNSQPFNVTYRLLVADSGQLSVGNTLFTPPSDGTVQIFTIPLTEGFLLGVSVTSSAGASAFRGTCFVSVQLGTGNQSAPQAVQILAQDYISLSYGIAWPGSAIRNSMDSQGFIQAIATANPGAGQDFTVTVAIGQRWRLLGLTAQLATSAAAGNRAVAIGPAIGVAQQWKQQYPAAQVPSSTSRYVYAPGATMTTGTLGDNTLGAPVRVILSSSLGIASLKSVTSGIDVADQWSNINSWWEQWIES